VFSTSLNLAPFVRVFTYRNYAWFMGGMCPNLITIWMQRVGVGWLAWELTHSPTWLGIIAAADLVPMLFLAPIAGAVTDRVVPLNQARAMQILALLHSVALVVAILSGWMVIEVLLVLTLFHGVTHTFASTARHAIVPATVPRPEFASAIAIDSALFNASRFVGPALAGLAIPLGGVVITFAANAVGALSFLFGLHMMDLAPPDREPRPKRHIFGDVADALRYVRGHAGIGPVFFLLVVASVFIRPLQDMLPGFSGDVFQSGAVGLAWLTSAMGVGATISAIWIAGRGKLAGLTPMVILGLLGLTLSTLGFIATRSLVVGVVFAGIAGMTINLMSTGCQALVQTAVADGMRGRVMGLYTLIYRGLPAIGAVGMGVVAEFTGFQLAFVLPIAVCFVTWALMTKKGRTMAHALEGEH
jgi:MFS family permease